MDELLDIVNDEDIVIDQQMRSIVHQLGLQHRGVHVFLFTMDGKLLIQKRSADRAASPSLLDCSVSEHVKAGESYLEAAMRGMKEELGVEEVALQTIMKFRMNYGVNDNEISMLYKGVVDSTKIQFDRIEIEAIAYYELNELHAKMKNHPELFCGWFIEIMKGYFNEPANMIVMQDLQ